MTRFWVQIVLLCVKTLTDTRKAHAKWSYYYSTIAYSKLGTFILPAKIHINSWMTRQKTSANELNVCLTLLSSRCGRFLSAFLTTLFASLVHYPCSYCRTILRCTNVQRLCCYWFFGWSLIVKKLGVGLRNALRMQFRCSASLRCHGDHLIDRELPCNSTYCGTRALSNFCFVIVSRGCNLENND